MKYTTLIIAAGLLAFPLTAQSTGNGQGNGPGNGGCTLHNPHYDFNDEILSLGIRYWVMLVQTVLRGER